MTKKTFLKKLEEKLDILDKKEIDDIVFEYKAHIENKIKEGKTEKEAVEELGDIDELVSEILTAYKINSKKTEPANKFEKFITNVVDEIGEFFSNLLDSLSNQDTSKTVVTIFYVIFGLIMLSILMWFIRIPFEILKDIGVGVLGATGNNFFSDAFSTLWVILVDFAVIVFSIILIVAFFKKAVKYFENNNEKIEKEAKKVDPIIKKALAKKEKPTKEVNPLFELFMLLLKIFVIISFFFPLVMANVGLLITLGILVFLLVEGVCFTGMFFIIMGTLFITLTLTSILARFLFKKGGVK